MYLACLEALRGQTSQIIRTITNPQEEENLTLTIVCLWIRISLQVPFFGGLLKGQLEVILLLSSCLVTALEVWR